MLESVWWLLQPSSLLILLLAFALFGLQVRWYALSRFLLTTVLLLLLLVALLPVHELLAAPLEQRVSAPATLPEEVDGIIVLGGAVDWEVSRSRKQLSVNGAAERMMAAAALARRYPAARLVLTGVFRELLPGEFRADPGPQSLIFGPEFSGREITFLGEARSTYEEALLAVSTLKPRAGERWLLVTSALHMPRALGVFETQGWRVIPYPVDYRTSGRLAFDPTPDVAGALAELDHVLREWGAYLVYRRTGRIRLGE